MSFIDYNYEKIALTTTSPNGTITIAAAIYIRVNIALSPVYQPANTVLAT